MQREAGFNVLGGLGYLSREYGLMSYFSQEPAGAPVQPRGGWALGVCSTPALHRARVSVASTTQSG